MFAAHPEHPGIYVALRWSLAIRKAVVCDANMRPLLAGGLKTTVNWLALLERPKVCPSPHKQVCVQASRVCAQALKHFLS
jgi:hypothetical protein